LLSLDLVLSSIMRIRLSRLLSIAWLTCVSCVGEYDIHTGKVFLVRRWLAVQTLRNNTNDIRRIYSS
jgi:hypothetical protein